MSGDSGLGPVHGILNQSLYNLGSLARDAFGYSALKGPELKYNSSLEVSTGHRHPLTSTESNPRS